MADEVFGREELNRPIDNERLNNLFSNIKLNNETKKDTKDYHNLEKKLEDKADEFAKTWSENTNEYYDIKRIYLEIATPLEKMIEIIKRDVILNFGNEYNVLVAKLLNKWEIEK